MNETKRVLVVSVSDIDAIHFTIILTKKAGLAAQYTLDKSEVINLLETNPADLVIFYEVQGDEALFNLCHELRKHPTFAKLPLLMFIVSNQTDFIDRAIQAGINEVYVYPMGPDFLDVVRRLSGMQP